MAYFCQVDSVPDEVLTPMMRMGMPISCPLPVATADPPVLMVMVPVVVDVPGSPDRVSELPLLDVTVRPDRPLTLELDRVSPLPMAEAKTSPAGREMVVDDVEVVTWSATKLGPRLVSWPQSVILAVPVAHHRS